jgi:hypothetical protein
VTLCVVERRRAPSLIGHPAPVALCAERLPTGLAVRLGMPVAVNDLAVDSGRRVVGIVFAEIFFGPGGSALARRRGGRPRCPRSELPCDDHVLVPVMESRVRRPDSGPTTPSPKVDVGRQSMLGVDFAEVALVISDTKLWDLPALDPV